MIILPSLLPFLFLPSSSTSSCAFYSEGKVRANDIWQQSPAKNTKSLSHVEQISCEFDITFRARWQRRRRRLRRRVPLIARRCTTHRRLGRREEGRKGPIMPGCCRPIWPPSVEEEEEEDRANFRAFSKLSQSYGGGGRERGQHGVGSQEASLSLSSNFSEFLLFSPHSRSPPIADLSPQWPVLDLVKLVSEITKRDKEKPAAMENGLMSF